MVHETTHLAGTPVTTNDLPFDPDFLASIGAIDDDETLEATGLEGFADYYIPQTEDEVGGTIVSDPDTLDGRDRPLGPVVVH